MSFHFFFANKGDFLLDKIPSIVAISTSRKLSSNASYAMRIRRASDDAELDVGFAGNSIDEQAIKDFGGYNLLGYTEDLTHPSWLKENFNTSGQIPVVTPNATSNPLTGEQNATRIDFDAVNSSGISSIRQVTSGFNNSQLIEVYLRAVSGTANLRMRIDSDQTFANNYTITETWTKFTITTQPNHTNSKSWGLRLRPIAGTSTTASVYIYAPQWVQGSTSLPYQPRLQGGASDCFVTTLYDQSGNRNHANQTVVTNQPKVYDVATGDLTKENGKPAMVFDGAGDHLSIPNVAGRSNIDAYFVNKHDDTSTTAINNEVYLYPTGDGGSNFGIVGSKNSLNASLHSSSYGSPSLYKNNTLLSPTNRGEVYSLLGQTQSIINHKGASTSSWNEYQYGLYSAGGGLFHFEGTLQEIIIFDRNLTTKERTLLHSDMNNHFNIY